MQVDLAQVFSRQNGSNGVTGTAWLGLGAFRLLVLLRWAIAGLFGWYKNRSTA